MRKLALLLMAALLTATAGCGGDEGGSGSSGDDEAKIRSVVEQAFQEPDDPKAFCALFSQRALDDDSDAKGEGARRACEKEVAESDYFPEKAEILKLTVDGDSATARLRVTENGETETGSVELTKVEGDWLIDGSEQLDVL